MEMDVHKLIETIGISVAKAQQGIEQHSILNFFDYFTHNDSANSNGLNNTPEGYKPITEKMILPCIDDINKNAAVEIPLVALAHHRQVHLDKITVRLKTRISSNSSGAVMADIDAPVSNLAHSPDKSEEKLDDKTGEIELVFSVSESSEGLSRVVQNITKTI